jgi:hypothetical protein
MRRTFYRKENAMRLKERTGKKRGGFPVWVVALFILVAASIAYLAVNKPKPPVQEKKVEPAAAPKPEPALQVELAPKAACCARTAQACSLRSWA